MQSDLIYPCGKDKKTEDVESEKKTLLTLGCRFSNVMECRGIVKACVDYAIDEARFHRHGSLN